MPSRPDLVVAVEPDWWWPWSPARDGAAPCPQSAVLFDALRRRLTLSGTLQACCAEKVSRVRDFVMVVTPGDTSIDVSGVTVLDPSVASILCDWQDRLAARDRRLSILGASPQISRALAR